MDEPRVGAGPDLDRCAIGGLDARVEARLHDRHRHRTTCSRPRVSRTPPPSFNLASIGQPGRLVESGRRRPSSPHRWSGATEDYISGQLRLTPPDTSSLTARGASPTVGGVVTHVVADGETTDPADRVERATRLRGMRGQIPDLLSVEGSDRLVQALGRWLLLTWCCGRRALTSIRTDLLP